MKLTDKQRDRISGIAGDIGKIFFAALFVGQFLPGFQGSLSPAKLLAGFVASGLCWVGSVVVLKGDKNGSD